MPRLSTILYQEQPCALGGDQLDAVLHARDRNLKLPEVARAVAAGDLDIPLPAGRAGPARPGPSPAG